MRNILAQILDIVLRTKKARLISLPKKIKGANCSNCHYWRDTNDERIGYCAHSEVSIFITKNQLCNYWAEKDAVSALTKTKLDLEPDYRDFPPPANEIDFKFNSDGGLVYADESRDRAEHCEMKTIPKDQQGASCYNCTFSTSSGWCKNAKVNQPINKDMLCNFWYYPGTKKLKRD